MAWIFIAVYVLRVAGFRSGPYGFYLTAGCKKMKVSGVSKKKSNNKSQIPNKSQ